MKTEYSGIIAILSLVLSVLCLGGCSYSEQPPKTTDSSSNYVLPKGEIPSQEDLDEVKVLQAEYDNAVGNNK